MQSWEIRGLGFRNSPVSHVRTSTVFVSSNRESPSIDIAPCDADFSRRPLPFSTISLFIRINLVLLLSSSGCHGSGMYCILLFAPGVTPRLQEWNYIWWRRIAIRGGKRRCEYMECSVEVWKLGFLKAWKGETKFQPHRTRSKLSNLATWLRYMTTTSLFNRASQ